MKKQSIILQLTGWAVSFLLFYLYLGERLATYEWSYVLAITCTSFASFAVIIYGYVYLLYPRFRKRHTSPGFLLAVGAFYLLVVTGRLVAEKWLVAPLTERTSIFTLGNTHLLYDLISCFFALVVGILFKSVVENFALQKREIEMQRLQAEMRRKQVEAELKLLKAQVQPHFLFNSFNNLYYETYKVLPDVASRIAKLSAIMRYFLEESPKSKVPLQTEIDFIQSYMELEKVRFKQPPDIQLHLDQADGIHLPPMLLMPLVENLYKHGIDKMAAENKATITLQVKDQAIDFRICNSVHSQAATRTGTGLQNLKERLQILYGDNFRLETIATDSTFEAHLVIPVA